jgi:hypothetical protein
MFTDATTRNLMIEVIPSLEKLVSSNKDGNLVEILHNSLLRVENPHYLPDNGADPYIIISLEELSEITRVFRLNQQTSKTIQSIMASSARLAKSEGYLTSCSDMIDLMGLINDVTDRREVMVRIGKLMHTVDQRFENDEG